jgi:hypothetical protein
VRFRIADVFLPGTSSQFSPNEGETELEGTIIAFSDSGSTARFFAVIEVVKTQSLIVPVEKVEVVSTSNLHGDA